MLTVSDAIIRTLLVLCTFIGLGLLSVVLCCYHDSKKRPHSVKAKHYMRTGEDSLGSCHCLPQTVAQKSVVEELNQRLHVNGRAESPVGSAMTSGRKFSKQTTPVTAKREKQHRFVRYDNQGEAGLDEAGTTSSGINLNLAQDTATPKLPKRLYLTDIEFVTKEYDLIMCCRPKRLENCDNLSKGTQVHTNLTTHTDRTRLNTRDGSTVIDRRENRRSTLSLLVLSNEYDLPIPNNERINYSPKVSNNCRLPRTYRRQAPTATSFSTTPVIYDEVSSTARGYVREQKHILRKSLSYDNMWQFQQQQQLHQLEAPTVYQNIGSIRKDKPVVPNEESDYQPLLIKHGADWDENLYMEVEKSISVGI